MRAYKERDDPMRMGQGQGHGQGQGMCKIFYSFFSKQKKYSFCRNEFFLLRHLIIRLLSLKGLEDDQIGKKKMDRMGYEGIIATSK